jgi:hypothetical protein
VPQTSSLPTLLPHYKSHQDISTALQSSTNDPLANRSVTAALAALPSPTIEPYPSPPLQSSAATPTSILLDKTQTLPVPPAVASSVLKFATSYNLSLPFAYSLWLTSSSTSPASPAVAAADLWRTSCVLHPLLLLSQLLASSQHSALARWVDGGAGIKILCDSIGEWCHLSRYRKETKEAEGKRDLCREAAILGE